MEKKFKDRKIRKIIKNKQTKKQKEGKKERQKERKNISPQKRISLESSTKGSRNSRVLASLYDTFSRQERKNKKQKNRK